MFLCLQINESLIFGPFLLTTISICQLEQKIDKGCGNKAPTYRNNKA